MRELNWGGQRLRKETGLWPASVLRQDHVKPEYVVAVSSALNLDISNSLHRAGWEITTLLQRRIIESLQIAKHHSVIGKDAGVSSKLIGLYLRDPDMTPTNRVLDKLAPVLGLTQSEIQAIRDGRQPRPPQSAESRRQAVNTLKARNPEYFRELGKIAGKASWTDREQAMERAREQGARRRVSINRDPLADLLKSGKTYAEVGAILHVAASTVRRCAKQYHLRSQLGQTTWINKKAARARAGRENASQRRRQQALAELAILGTSVIYVDYRTFAKRHKVRAEWALAALQKAKAELGRTPNR
jgi:hypothetical protein